jgi:DNA-binding NarL/FixJ family response regulator
MKIILVDDHKMVREGLREMLRSMPDVEVIAEAADGREGVRLAKMLSPDVVVMDIDMPGLSGFEATRQITANGNGAKVIALTASSSANAARQMLSAGASAFVVKAAAFRDFHDALKAVRAGTVYFSPGLADSVLRELARTNGNGSTALSRLTARERETLRLLAEGYATKEIAAKLALSIKTIETHRKNLMDKLDMHTVAQLTKYAIREGITSP